MQDFICYSTLVHFPLSGTATDGVTAFNLTGRTIDRAYLVLGVASPPINPTNLQAHAVATAWNTNTVTGITDLSLYTNGGQLQGSPLYYGPYAFNVTTIVQNWANGSFGNNGILIEDAEYVFPLGDAIRTSWFWSTDTGHFNASPVNRPTLWVDYH